MAHPNQKAARQARRAAKKSALRRSENRERKDQHGALKSREFRLQGRNSGVTPNKSLTGRPLGDKKV